MSTLLEQAKRELHKLSLQDVARLKSYINPPRNVHKAMLVGEMRTLFLVYLRLLIFYFVFSFFDFLVCVCCVVSRVTRG